MKSKALHPTFRLGASGVLSLLVLFIWSLSLREPQWCIVLGGVAAAAFLVLTPVLLLGDSWQKTLAAALLFVPSFGLVMAALGIVSSK